MVNAIEVSDPASNAPEQIENAAKAIGRSKDRRAVFEAIYHGRAKIKTVAQIAERTGLSQKRVLEEGRILVVKGAVKEATRDGRRAYEKINFIHAHKARVLSLAGKPANLSKWPTRRRVELATPVPKFIRISTRGAKVKRVTIDDIDSFAKVKKARATAYLGDTLSEDDFKQGIKTVLGELGVFKDWGGETSDLYSSQARMKGKRHAVAFAFKGPGLKGKLVPGKMGANGDQIQRLFREDADIYIAQHHAQIDPSVLQEMLTHAIARWDATGNTIYYGVIDGQDSERLRLAYPKAFVARPKKKKPRLKGKAVRK